jgi:kynureninase
MAALQALEDEARALDLSFRDRSFFEALDAEDEFAHLRARFHIPKAKAGSGRDDAIYLCGNSLGAMPRKARTYVNAELDKWAAFGVDGHFEEPHPWVSIDESVQASSARLVGAETSEVAVMNSLTVNLHLMMAAFYKPGTGSGRVKILVEGKAFPSDMHMLQSQVRWHGLDPATTLITLQPRDGEVTLRTDDIVAVIEQHKDELALVLMSGLQYYTGQLFEVSKKKGFGALVNTAAAGPRSHRRL